MKSGLLRVLSAAVGLTMMTGAAMAESISFSGTVTASRTAEVYAPIGGTVETVYVEDGQQVTADTVLCSLKTTKVYAAEDGTVTGVFGQPGDSATDVAGKYGAVMYLEGNEYYSVSASTDNAYNTAATKYVHVGETVYLVSRSDSDVTGTGYISSISGTDYTVVVTDGAFILGASVYIYRSSSHNNASRIGSGKISRRDPTAVTGSGSIVSIAVSDGDVVKRGDLLFETLDGSFDGMYMSGNQIYADADGIVAQLNCSQGASVQKGGVVAVLYPTDAMRIEGSVSETELADIAVGDKVNIEMTWNEDSDVTYEGTITMISAMANTSANGDAATYTVYVDFTPDANTRYGMTATVTTLEN